MKVPKFDELSRLGRFTLVVVALWVLFLLFETLAGQTTSAGGFLDVLLPVTVIAWIFRGLRHLARRMVWRVRNRLLITYVFIAVVPIVLILAMFAISAYMLVGQVGAYLTVTELARRQDSLFAAAYDYGLAASYRMRAEGLDAASMDLLNDVRSRMPRFSAVVRRGERQLPEPPDGVISAIPEWSRPGFRGLVEVDRSSMVVAVHSEVTTGGRTIEVFAYEPADGAMYAELLPGLVTLRVDRSANGVLLDPSGRNLPEGIGFWDVPVSWFTVLDYRGLRTGVSNTRGAASRSSLVAVITTRPSLIFRRLLSVSGNAAFVVVWVLIITAVTFLVAEAVALIAGVGLTRSITRAVDALYAATLKIQGGNLDHRIAVRSRDQLGELSTSFNHMAENVQRLIVEVKEKEKLESELEIAREVQMQFFPKSIPTLHTLDLLGLCQPARVVSGDYYDFISLDQRYTALAIGDISGKGISAALLMASLRSLLHAQIKNPAASLRSPEETAWLLNTSILIERINDQLFESTPMEKFATLYCGLYDDESGVLSYTNAGHLPPVLIRRGSMSRLDVTGMVVGAFPGMKYERRELALERGDLLIAYTDGITESENARNEQFGDSRFSEVLMRFRDRPLSELARAITDAVNDWTGTADLQDDTTLLLARRV